MISVIAIIGAAHATALRTIHGGPRTKGREAAKVGSSRPAGTVLEVRTSPSPEFSTGCGKGGIRGLQ